jgi:hypothetical protein
MVFQNFFKWTSNVYVIDGLNQMTTQLVFENCNIDTLDNFSPYFHKINIRSNPIKPLQISNILRMIWWKTLMVCWWVHEGFQTIDLINRYIVFNTKIIYLGTNNAQFFFLENKIIFHMNIKLNLTGHILYPLSIVMGYLAAHNGKLILKNMVKKYSTI